MTKHRTIVLRAVLGLGCLVGVTMASAGHGVAQAAGMPGRIAISGAQANESHWTRISPLESHWTRISPQESHWTRISPLESHWTRVSPQESHWTRISPQESHWTRVSPLESHWTGARA